MAHIDTTVISSPLDGRFINVAQISGIGPQGRVIRMRVRHCCRAHPACRLLVIRLTRLALIVGLVMVGLGVLSV